MRVVTRRTGLSAELLRVWEKRYGVVRPARSESGRRLYSDADVERLQLLYRATLAGRGIGQVAPLPDAVLAELVRGDAAAGGLRTAPEAGRAPVGEPSDAYLRQCLDAVVHLDAPALDAVLRRAAVALSATAFLDALVSPLLERLGTGWQEGTLRPVHGHLASAVLRRVLDGIAGSATSPIAAPGLVVATPAGQAHEFGALLAAAAAAAEGWRVTYLGASLPAEDLAEAAERTRARAVALSVVYPAGDQALAHELRRLATLLPRGTALVVGGAAASSYRAAIEQAGAAQLADLVELRAHLRELRVLGVSRG